METCSVPWAAGVHATHWWSEEEHPFSHNLALLGYSGSLRARSLVSWVNGETVTGKNSEWLCWTHRYIAIHNHVIVNKNVKNTSMEAKSKNVSLSRFISSRLILCIVHKCKRSFETLRVNNGCVGGLRERERESVCVVLRSACQPSSNRELVGCLVESRLGYSVHPPGQLQQKKQASNSCSENTTKKKHSKWRHCAYNTGQVINIELQ